jgi:hypothetical protein
MAMIIAALLFGYAKSRALSEHAKQYGRMSIIFANAKRHLEELMRAGRYARAPALIEELGKEALVENGDWVHLHRERPLQVPKARPRMATSDARGRVGWRGTVEAI